MFTALVLFLIACGWIRSGLIKVRAPSPLRRMKTAQWAWAFGGAALGSYVGVAGLGTAIAGTIPGALVGWILAGYLMMTMQAGLARPPEPAALRAGASVRAAAKARDVAESFFLWIVKALRIVVLYGAMTFAAWWAIEHGWIDAPESLKQALNFGTSAPPPSAEAPQPETLPNAAPAFETPRPVAAPTSATPAPAAIPSADQALQRAEYTDVLAQIELQYPQLDPTSSQYDEAIANSIAARMRTLVASMTPAQALRQAVAEAVAAAPAPQPKTRPTIEKTPSHWPPGSARPQ